MARSGSTGTGRMKPLGKVGKTTKNGHHAHTSLPSGNPLASGGNLGRGGSARRGARRGGAGRRGRSY